MTCQDGRQTSDLQTFYHVGRWHVTAQPCSGAARVLKWHRDAWRLRRPHFP